jgi:segregation and condensation protein A
MSQEQIHDLIFQEDDVRWQTIIYDLVSKGHVDPWDLDISEFSKQYIRMVRDFKKMNFKLSGKVVLAAAILLRLKTDKLGFVEFLAMTQDVEENPLSWDDYVSVDSEDPELVKAVEEGEKKRKGKGVSRRIPGVRKRKVTVFELMGALKKALDSEEKREERAKKIVDARKVKIPDKIKEKKVDIFVKIDAVLKKLRKVVKKKNSIGFSEILPSKEKKDVIWTIIPLLHLANREIVELRQDKPFGEIFVDISKEDILKPIKITEDRDGRVKSKG